MELTTKQSSCRNLRKFNKQEKERRAEYRVAECMMYDATVTSEVKKQFGRSLPTSVFTDETLPPCCIPCDKHFDAITYGYTSSQEEGMDNDHLGVRYDDDDDENDDDDDDDDDDYENESTDTTESEST